MYDVTKTIIKKLHEDAILPIRGSEEAVGADLSAYLNNITIRVTSELDNHPHDVVVEGSITLQSLGRALIPVGLMIKPALNHEVQIRSRSGLPINKGLIVGNGIGTIDPDYLGEIKVSLINVSPLPVTISHGDRIAQMVLAPVLRNDDENTVYILDPNEDVHSFISSRRGVNGFGSTDNFSILNKVN